MFSPICDIALDLCWGKINGSITVRPSKGPRWWGWRSSPMHRTARARAGARYCILNCGSHNWTPNLAGIPDDRRAWLKMSTEVKVSIHTYIYYLYISPAGPDMLQYVRVREDIRRKSVFFRTLPESPKPPPPWPQFGQLGPFFSDVKIQDLKVTWGEGREIY